MARSLVSLLPGNQTPQKILFHYTSAHGLLGLLSTRALWATHFFFLNDWNEGDRGFGIVCDLIERRRKKCSGAASEFLDEIDGTMPLYVPGTNPPNYCTFSLSAAKDLLSQWRAYGSGGGYCLGFETEVLLHVFREQGYLFGRCLYHDQDQKRALSGLLTRYLKSLSSKPRQETLFRQARQFWHDVERIQPFFKAPAFHEEQEWRFVSPPLSSAELSFRVRDGAIIPYQSIQLDGQPIREIGIGPSREQYLSGEATQLTAQHFQLDQCKIWQSTAPLRD